MGTTNQDEKTKIKIKFMALWLGLRLVIGTRSLFATMISQCYNFYLCTTAPWTWRSSRERPTVMNRRFFFSSASRFGGVSEDAADVHHKFLLNFFLYNILWHLARCRWRIFSGISRIMEIEDVKNSTVSSCSSEAIRFSYNWIEVDFVDFRFLPFSEFLSLCGWALWVDFVSEFLMIKVI